MIGWVDYRAAARSAGVTDRTIRRWVQQGRLTPRNGLICMDELEQVKIGRHPLSRLTRVRTDLI